MLPSSLTQAIRLAHLQSQRLQREQERRIAEQNKAYRASAELREERDLQRAKRIAEIQEAQKRREEKAAARARKATEQAIERCNKAIAACHYYKTLTTKPDRLLAHDQRIEYLTKEIQTLTDKLNKEQP